MSIVETAIYRVSCLNRTVLGVQGAITLTWLIYTFAIGSFVMLGAAAMLRLVNSPETPVDINQAEIVKLPLQKLALILATGFGVAWGIRFLMDVLGKVLKTQLNTDNIDIQAGVCIAGSGIFETQSDAEV
ncbi:MAG: hypothetical protein V7K67_35040 [Nostoc sp.]|uniref:hypothetical protein n=1 Tax=Nostoc sp. TaxID=1180 RepID=UPI002FF10717